jgi:hypothetical protein
MVTLARARRIALYLPETVEMDHHGFPSFRVRGKIFATNPDPGHFNILLDEPGIHAAIAAYPRAVEGFWWGSRLSTARLMLQPATLDCITDLLLQAWTRRAPKKLLADTGWQV